jgi:hypothetical protein
MKVIEIIETTLATRGSYDNAAYQVEQTYKAVQRLEKAPSITTPPPPTSSSTTTENPKAS